MSFGLIRRPLRKAPGVLGRIPWAGNARFSERGQARRLSYCTRYAALLAVTSIFAALPVSAAWNSLRANNRSAHEEHRGGRAVQQGTREFPAAPTGRVESERARPAERVTVPERGREHIERSVRGREEIQRELREHRRWDIPEARRHTFFWSDYYPGLAVSILPSGYVPVYVGGSPYYYYQGVFYQQGPSGYSVAPPPIGAVVPELPPGAEPVMVGPATYYYAAGVFYAQEPQGFVVVPPPPGATVSILPPGATSAVVNGVVYYQANGVYYMPVMQDGVTVYTVTRF